MLFLAGIPFISFHPPLTPAHVMITQERVDGQGFLSKKAKVDGATRYYGSHKK